MEAPPSSPTVIRRQSNPSPERIASNATISRLSGSHREARTTLRGPPGIDQAAVDEALRQAEETMAEADSLAEELGFEECSPTGITTGL
jgi:hypothetical protein